MPSYESLLICYRSGQISELQWCEHLRDEVFRKYVEKHQGPLIDYGKLNSDIFQAVCRIPVTALIVDGPSFVITGTSTMTELNKMGIIPSGIPIKWEK